MSIWPLMVAFASGFIVAVGVWQIALGNLLNGVGAIAIVLINGIFLIFLLNR